MKRRWPWRRRRMPRVLFIEPDRELPEKAQALLPEFLFEVVTTAAEGRRRIQADPPDAVILADPLPDGDACEIAEELRGRIPVLLTPTRSDDDEPPGRALRQLSAAEVRPKRYSLWMLRRWLDDLPTAPDMPTSESFAEKNAEFALVWKTIKAKWKKLAPAERLSIEVRDLRTQSSLRHVYSTEVGSVSLSYGEQSDIAIDVPELGKWQIGLEPKDNKLELHLFQLFALEWPAPVPELSPSVNDQELSWDAARYLKSGDRLRLGHIEVVSTWQESLGPPLKIGEWILPSDPTTRSFGRYAIAKPKSNSTVEPNVLLVREANEWRVAFDMWIGFDSPRPDILIDSERPNVAVIWHGYHMAFTLDGGQTFCSADMSALGCSRLGPYVQPEVFIENGELIFAVSDIDMSVVFNDRPPPERRTYRLLLTPDAVPIAIDTAPQPPPRTEPKLLTEPLRIEGQSLLYRCNDQWQEVPAIELIRGHADANGVHW